MHFICLTESVGNDLPCFDRVNDVLACVFKEDVICGLFYIGRMEKCESKRPVLLSSRVAVCKSHEFSRTNEVKRTSSLS